MATPREELEQLRALAQQGSQQIAPLSPRQELEQLRGLAQQQAQAVQQPAQPITQQSFPESFKKTPLGALATAIPPEMITGADRETRATRELPELGKGGLLSGEDTAKVAEIAPVLLATTNPREIAQILSANFPNVGITEDEKGNLIAGNNNTGAQVVINQPGLSQLDLVQGLGLGSFFTSPAQLASLAPSLVGKVALGVAGAGLGATAIEAEQERLGGEFQAEQIPLTAALGGAAEVAVPLVQAIGTAGRPLAEAVTGTLRDALKKGKVLTSDVFPPTTFMGKGFQKATERIPFIGTGKVRAQQQVTRQEAVEDIAREFDINPATGFEKEIVQSADRIFKGAQKKAARLRKEAVTELDKLGNVTPTAALREIDDQITQIAKLGERGDKSLLETLQNIKGELAGDFTRLKNIRTTIFDDIADVGGGKSPIRSGGDASLTRVAGALSKDLEDFAVNASKGATGELRKASNKWKASNRIFKDNFAKARETELKRVLTKGKATPEVVNSVIKGGKQSELSRLHGNIDLAGRKSVRQQILKLTLERSGFPERVNPTVFLNELNRPNNKRAINTFFKGSDRRQLEGAKKFLDMTRRAQEEAASIATQQEVTGISLAAGAIAAPKPVIGIAAATGLFGRAYETKPVRDLLIKLSNLPPRSSKALEVIEQLKPLLPVVGRE